MARRPLTEMSAQGWAQQPRRKMGNSQKRVYGKRGTASSRAVLSDQFLDENEIDKQMLKKGPGQAVSRSSSSSSSLSPLSPLSPFSDPLLSEDDAKPVPPAPVAPVVHKGKRIQSVLAVDAVATAYVSPLLAECHESKGLRDFSAWARKVAESFRVMKVAEGSFGEVFKLEKRNMPSERAASTPQRGSDAYGGSIFKLIPLRAKSTKSNKQTSLDTLVREVQMLKRMDPIPGFARFRKLTVLQGAYPPSFTEAYFDHKARRASDSQNPEPSKYSEKQLWAMIEMDDGGTDLEMLKTPSAYQIFDIFWLTCCTLSYGEELAEFEHRDLHIGNICIKPINATDTVDISPDLNTSLPPTKLRRSTFGYSNLRTTIIDYTLSRAKANPDPDSTSTSAPHPTTSILHDPTPTPSLFTQTGKTPSHAHQCTTYRKMRTHALQTGLQSRTADPSRENRKTNKWARFMPRTNVLWLECLLWTLLHRSEGRAVEGSTEVMGGVQEAIYEGLRRLLAGLEGRGEVGSAREVVEWGGREGLLGGEDLSAIKECLDGD